MSKRNRSTSIRQLLRQRSPGLHGTYDGTCIACLQPTDTALAVRGDLKEQVAFLVALGVPFNEAVDTITVTAPLFRTEPRVHVTSICSACAQRADLPPPVLAARGSEIPVVVRAAD